MAGSCARWATVNSQPSEPLRVLFTQVARHLQPMLSELWLISDEEQRQQRRLCSRATDEQARGQGTLEVAH